MSLWTILYSHQNLLVCFQLKDSFQAFNSVYCTWITDCSEWVVVINSSVSQCWTTSLWHFHELGLHVLQINRAENKWRIKEEFREETVEIWWADVTLCFQTLMLKVREYFSKARSVFPHITQDVHTHLFTDTFILVFSFRLLTY